MLGTWPSTTIRPVLQGLLRLEEGADLDKFITIRATMSTPDSPEFREAQEQYRWLGQQAPTGYATSEPKRGENPEKLAKTAEMCLPERKRVRKGGEEDD